MKKNKSKTKNKPNDVIQLILKDHLPIKKLIKILKNSDATMSEKKSALKKFFPTLLAHTKAEEEGEMFKKVRKEFNTEKRGEIGEEYIRLHAEHKNDLQEDSRSRNKRTNGETEKFL